MRIQLGSPPHLLKKVAAVLMLIITPIAAIIAISDEPP